MIRKNIKAVGTLITNCRRSIADIMQAAGYLIFDKILLFDGGSISRKNLRVNKIFTGSQNGSQNK
jgi:hypothetical protein